MSGSSHQSTEHRALAGLMVSVIVALSLIILFQVGILPWRSDAATIEPEVSDVVLEVETVVEVEMPVVVEAKEEIKVVVDEGLFEYVVVTDSCGPFYENECLQVRSGPGLSFPVVSKLRNGMVLRVDGSVEADGLLWHKVIFDEWLRYPERLTTDWYVAADFVEAFKNEGEKTSWDEVVAATTTDKVIVVDRSEQKLYAYQGEDLFMETSISTGLELTPTPRGTFTIFKKTPSRYMQGPLPNLAVQKTYDLPGVPWNLYFTEGGAVIHGAYWHKGFGSPYSNGCVNMVPEEARELYGWAEVGTTVTVRD